MYANFPLLYSAAQSITQEYSSSSAHHVMESMRGAMAKVGLFIYVLEKEVAIFQRQCFPMELQLESSSPFECLIPLEIVEALHQSTARTAQ